MFRIAPVYLTNFICVKLQNLARREIFESLENKLYLFVKTFLPQKIYQDLISNNELERAAKITSVFLKFF